MHYPKNVFLSSILSECLKYDNARFRALRDSVVPSCGRVPTVPNVQYRCPQYTDMSRQSPSTLGAELITREQLLRQVAAEEPIGSNALARNLTVSVSTVNRVVSQFVRAGLFRRTDEGITLTDAGEVLTAEVSQFIKTVETTQALESLIGPLTAVSPPAELRWFTDGTIVTATPRNPYAPLSRYSELFTEAEHKYLVGDRFVVPEQGIDAACRAIEHGVVCTCIWSSDALSGMAERHPELMEWSAGRDELTGMVAESVPLDFALFDDRLLVYGFADETGVLSVLADTTNPEAVKWGTELFARLQTEATAIDPGSE